MANVKISELPAAGTLSGSELVELVQSGTSVQSTAAAVANEATAISVQVLTEQLYGNFLSTSAQTISADTPTPVQFPTTAVASAGLSITNDGSARPIRLTFGVKAMYTIRVFLRLSNTSGSDLTVYVWLRTNGTDVPLSTNTVIIPKSADGGLVYTIIPFVYDVTAVNDYLEIYWACSSTSASLQPLATQTVPYARPSAASAYMQVRALGPSYL